MGVDERRHYRPALQVEGHRSGRRLNLTGPSHPYDHAVLHDERAVVDHPSVAYYHAGTRE
ncbi:MAG: hypothetical protein DMF89_06135 [Acidobacteria bacterium]|nr:MAG: hypothetical protein DMF89_06135 [Acidobacteriota bacterium]